jgi:hypothetical protein
VVGVAFSVSPIFNELTGGIGEASTGASIIAIGGISVGDASDNPLRATSSCTAMVSFVNNGAGANATGEVGVKNLSPKITNTRIMRK